MHVVGGIARQLVLDEGHAQAAGDVARRAGQELHQAERAGGGDGGGVEAALLARHGERQRALDRAGGAEIDHREGGIEQDDAALGRAPRDGQRHVGPLQLDGELGQQQRLAGRRHHAGEPQQEGPRALEVAGLAEVARHGDELAAGQRLVVGGRGDGIARQAARAPPGSLRAASWP